jgi:hypothetical protein
MGVRGHGHRHLPLDPQEDFDKPTTVPGSPASEEEVGHSDEEQAQEFTDAVAAPADPTQQDLPGLAVVPDTPQVIRNKQMFVDFVEAILARDKNDAPLLKLKFSFMLTPEHENYLPPEVIKAWKIVKQGDCKRFDIIEVPPQTITVNEVPDDEGTPPDLKIVSAVIERPSLQVIEESGSGKNKTGIRFSFLAITDRTEEPTEFAIRHDGDGVWITMGPTEPTLLKENENEGK